MEKGENIMITLFKWYVLKKKEIKLKLAFYSIIEVIVSEQEDIIKTITNIFESIKDLSGNELQEKIITVIAEMAHEQAVAERDVEKRL